MLNVGQKVSELRRMTVGELRREYAEVFGEPTRSFHKEFLVRRIAWRLQARVEGDLSEQARKRAVELAHDASSSLPRARAAGRRPCPDELTALAPASTRACRRRCGAVRSR
ncbi:MAG: DUF2924 domain-containing protein [Phycisphaerae bacterium]|nr:DUF2924 domain-containing protein [Phycisphaerae bacterium]